MGATLFPGARGRKRGAVANVAAVMLNAMQDRLAARHVAHPPTHSLPTIKEKVTHVRERNGVIKRADLMAAPVLLTRRQKKAWVRQQAARA